MADLPLAALVIEGATAAQQPEQKQVSTQPRLQDCLEYEALPGNGCRASAACPLSPKRTTHSCLPHIPNPPSLLLGPTSSPSPAAPSPAERADSVRSLAWTTAPLRATTWTLPGGRLLLTCQRPRLGTVLFW